MQHKWLTLYTHTTGPDSPTLLLAIYAYAPSHSVPNIYVSDVIFNFADGYIDVNGKTYMYNVALHYLQTAHVLYT